jgi:branched-chain amino acid transport system substrate-binding protein
MVLAGCSASTDGPGAGGGDSEPLKIGVLVPLSGAAGPNGKNVLEGVQAQVDIINDEGGVDGRKIEVVSRDDQSTPATGVSMATELIDEGVDVIMGGWNSPVTLAIQPITVRADVLNITSIPQNASILGGADETAVRMNAGNAIGGYTAAKYLSDTVGAKRVAMLLQNDAYGLDAGEFVKKNLPDDVDVVAEEKFEYTDTDFRVAISNVLAAKPDALYSANAAESSGQPALMQQLGASNIGFPYFAGTGTVSHTVVETAGADAVDTISADLYFPDAEPWASYERNVTFMKRFEADNSATPDKFAALGAQSVEVWSQAVAAAGSAERQKVADEIHGGSFKNTILGDVTFTEKGQQIFPMYAFKVSAQEITVLDQIEIPEKIWEE